MPQNQYLLVCLPSGPPSCVERLPLDHGATLPELTASVWDRASATSRPCHMAVAFVSATQVGWRAVSGPL